MVNPPRSSSCWVPRGKREWGDFWAERLSESLGNAAWCCGCDCQCWCLTQHRAERKPELYPHVISVSHWISRECTEWLTGIKYFARKLTVLWGYFLFISRPVKSFCWGRRILLADFRLMPWSPGSVHCGRFFSQVPETSFFKGHPAWNENLIFLLVSCFDMFSSLCLADCKWSLVSEKWKNIA